MKERDLDKNPYSADEDRVCDYLISLTPDIGCGDDPIGFLIASHAALARRGRRIMFLFAEGKLSKELHRAIMEDEA